MHNRNLDSLGSGANFDVVIVGAGINGAVSAAALSSRGLKVLLVDQSDFGSGTSQESSNLVWGGIKYLQSYEFWLVFKLCLARARLMRNYPNRVRKIGFLAALGPNAPFGKFMGTMGTLLYWVIGLGSTALPRTFSVKQALRLEPKFAAKQLRGAVRYFDGYLPDNDSRFVWDFVQRSIGYGATAKNYTRMESASWSGTNWNIELDDAASGQKFHVESQLLINAAGPWASEVLSDLKSTSNSRLAFSKGIHLIVPKITDSDRVLAFWDDQNRLFYVIPMGDRSVIGTTDTKVNSPTTEVTDEDRDFVLHQINKSMNLSAPLTKKDIISERCGVRPLVVNSKQSSEEIDWYKLSRKHVIEVDASKKLISIFGGKLTDCLNVGEEVMTEVKKLGFKLEDLHKWFGEDVSELSQEFSKFVATKSQKVDIAERVAEGLWRRHGKDAFDIASSSHEELEEVFEGTGICFAEVRHIIATEMVKTADDLLRRRLPIAMLRTSLEIKENQKLQDLLAGAKL